MVRKYRQFYDFVIIVGMITAILLCAMDASAQKKYYLNYVGLDGVYDPPKKTVDSSVLELKINETIRSLRSEGYWLSELRELSLRGDSAKATFYLGRKFDIVEIRLKIEDSLKVHRDQQYQSELKGDITEVNPYLEELLVVYENNGYPFASVEIDSARIENEKLHLLLDLQPGMIITYDSLSVSPKGVLKENFMSRYLGIRYDQLYNEKVLREIPDKFQNLPFVSLTDVGVNFRLKKAAVQLQLQKRKSSYFDGIVGMIPDQENGGVEFTGEINLSLKNLFQSAKILEFHWEKLRPESQKLEASYLHPLLLGSPLDLYLAYDQLKQDSTFSNRSLHVAFEYYPVPRLKMRVRYEDKLGNQLESNSVESGDFDISYYGFGSTYTKLDDRLNPKNGYFFGFDVGIGLKNIQGTTQSQSESTQYDFTAETKFYKRVASKSVIMAGVSGGLLVNDYLFLNDLYRLGGLKSIRGFNEGEFFASKYAFSTLEWRFYLDKESYLVAFYDQGLFSYEIMTGEFSDSPSGIGAGLQMETDSGNFQILYGLGKRSGESFSFDSSKIHFGYTALF